MSKNPCRNCENHYEWHNKHYPSGKCQRDCEKFNEHKKYLQSKRKFTNGEPIKSIDELLKQEWVMWGENTRHIEVVKHLQLSTVMKFLDRGYFRKAIRKEVANEP